MTEVRASLRNSDGSSTWDMPPNEGVTIPGGIFNKVVVSQGKWIFYNNSYNGNDGRSIVVQEGQAETDLGFFCESAREIKHAADGIALFEHYNYRGKTEVSSNIAGVFNMAIVALIIAENSKFYRYSLRQEVMFSPVFVCLSVCLSLGYLKKYCTDFYESLCKVGHRPRTNPLNFG